MTTFEKMALWHAAMRCAATIHTAAPGDLEALAAAGYIAHTIAPSFDESAAFARQHGLPAPDPDLHAAAMAKFAELAALVVLAPEQEH